MEVLIFDFSKKKKKLSILKNSKKSQNEKEQKIGVGKWEAEIHNFQYLTFQKNRLVCDRYVVEKKSHFQIIKPKISKVI